MRRPAAISNGEFLAFLFNVVVLLAIGLTITYFARQWAEKQFANETAIIDEDPEAVPQDAPLKVRAIVIVAAIVLCFLLILAAFRLSKLQARMMQRRAERRRARPL